MLKSAFALKNTFSKAMCLAGAAVWLPATALANTPASYEQMCSCIDANNGARQIPVTIRDFKASHPDFEDHLGTDRGIVKAQLGFDGRPVYAHGNDGTATTTGPDNFKQWFKTTAGINQSFSLSLHMTEIESGLWQYSNQQFFPIDGQGFGNEGNAHNYHFTLETHLKFIYLPGSQLSFRGDDDLWIFINGRLAVDLGGVHSAQEKVINLDDLAEQLGIEPYGSYSFDLFFAERHLHSSEFKFQTNFELECL